MTLQLRGITLPLSNFALAIDATFEQPVLGLFGPSGAGKTSLLDIIAGLRRPKTGTIKLNGAVLFDASTGACVPPRLRRVGYVPQDLALFPHLTVRANLLYGHRNLSGDDDVFTPDHVSEVMEIAPLWQRDVTTLSGGEQQRVAFARAILSAPHLLLLDEPMSSLDSRLKQRLIPFLHRIRDEFHIPLLYVTHDAAELTALCDEVVVLERGQVISSGVPDAMLAELNRSH